MNAEALSAKKIIDHVSRSEVIFREEVFNNLAILSGANGYAYVTISWALRFFESEQKSLRIFNRIKFFESLEKYQDLKDLELNVSLLTFIDKEKPRSSFDSSKVDKTSY